MDQDYSGERYMKSVLLEMQKLIPSLKPIISVGLPLSFGGDIDLVDYKLFTEKED